MKKFISKKSIDNKYIKIYVYNQLLFTGFIFLCLFYFKPENIMPVAFIFISVFTLLNFYITNLFYMKNFTTRTRKHIYLSKESYMDYNQEITRYNCLSRVCFTHEGKLHRVDEAAVFDNSFNNEEYWLYGKSVNREEVEKERAKMNIKAKVENFN